MCITRYKGRNAPSIQSPGMYFIPSEGAHQRTSPLPFHFKHNIHLQRQSDISIQYYDMFIIMLLGAQSGPRRFLSFRHLHVAFCPNLMPPAHKHPHRDQQHPQVRPHHRGPSTALQGWPVGGSCCSVDWLCCNGAFHPHLINAHSGT